MTNTLYHRRVIRFDEGSSSSAPVNQSVQGAAEPVSIGSSNIDELEEAISLHRNQDRTNTKGKGVMLSVIEKFFDSSEDEDGETSGYITMNSSFGSDFSSDDVVEVQNGEKQIEGEAIKGWIPRRADTFEKFGKTKMKQMVVIKVSMKDSKCRTKALKTVVNVPGVISAALQGPDKNQVVVIGEGMDATALTVLFRKKVGYSELVFVTPVDEKKKDTEIKTVMNPFIFTPYQYGTPHMYEVRDASHESNCTIM